jgi:hypothetical protein
VFACLDPYAIRDILNHWSWATPQLQLLVVIKVVTAFLTFYYVGLLILALIFRTPFAANGDCTSEASSDGEVAFKIKLNSDADHNLRGALAFVGEIQIFSRVHGGIIDSSNGGIACKGGPIGTFLLDGITSQESFGLTKARARA